MWFSMGEITAVFPFIFLGCTLSAPGDLFIFSCFIMLSISCGFIGVMNMVLEFGFSRYFFKLSGKCSVSFEAMDVKYLLNCSAISLSFVIYT